MTQLRRRFEVTDDSGFLALVDHHAYDGFVDKQWTYDTLFAHFRAAMAQRSLLLWGTGREGFWTVDVVVGEPAPQAGFRRTSGPIQVTSGQLHVLNYESLTMAAQFADVRLPEPYMRDLVLELPTGSYGCEIVQLDDPDGDIDDESERERPHFLVTLTAGQQPEPWSQPAWHDD
ncbi:hypothetical protein [Plantactinospora soyae]|uniref:Uncharacterized protein n=1 Tax=Plantactinospora soyae TaxID=1544732 RepID=A0A927R4W2_9ACTN|nr:hypothetical protein [Plantactinospora soyae]MBE1485356.1 hypothetical protein [Plantactinospora soyae]